MLEHVTRKPPEAPMITRRPSVVDWVSRIIVALSVICTPAIAGAQVGTGAEKFNALCAACHTIGGGRRVGPDLQGVYDRRSAEWLLDFVTSPQKMISKGDPVAVQLQQEFGVMMPDPPYSADEIKEILAYVKAAGAAGQAAAPAAVPERAATAEDVSRGRALFQGHLRFANGGPTCNSCHHVRNDAVIGGGVVARELTTVFGRMGAPGIHAILGAPPFPVMEEAYRGRPLTDYEVFALVAFLQDADQHQALQQPRDY
ncbi:MAG: cytochrome c, partial [bacterium]